MQTVMESDEGLRNAIRDLHHSLATEMQSNWKRDLPLTELLSNRWERAKRLGFGEGTSIYDSAYIFGEVKVGRNTWIGPMTILDGSGGLTIGDYCSISAGVQIYTHESVAWALTGGKQPYPQAPTKIGSNCYIGSQTVIRMGVEIGDRCVIGSCAFVNRSAPPNSILMGVPARRVGRVEIDADDRVQLIYE